MKNARLERVMGLDPERVARMLAEVHEEGGPPEPGKRLASLAARLGEVPEKKAEKKEPIPEVVPEPQTPPAPRESPHDLLRRTLIEYGEVLKRYREDFDRLFAEQPDQAAGEDETLRRLQQARMLLIKYPVAAQALFAALVAEGRRYAQTPDGKRQQAALVDSDLVRKGRAVFEAVSAGVLGEHEGPLPSAFLEAFLEATRRDGLEGVLGRMFGGVQ